MPSNEIYRSYFESPSQKWREVPKVVRNLYRDERAFGLYQKFKELYAGDPYIATSPEIIREREGRTILYDMPVLSAITTRGNHLICVRAGHAIHQSKDQNDGGAPWGLDARLQFFVATADFNTFDTTEWWLSDVRTSAINQPNRLELVLQHPHTDTGNQTTLHTVGSHPFDELDYLDSVSEARAEADAAAMKFVYENQRAHLTWGDGKAVSTFRSFSEIEADLYLLHKAEAEGQFGSEPVGHSRVIEHVQRRVA